MPSSPQAASPATPHTHQTRPRVLLLSAYDAGSHRQWRETLVAMLPDFQWTCLSLPARHFSWRVRGNSLSWAFNHRRELTDNHDILVATSLTDLASLRGFVPELARLPTLVYFHENQFAYPDTAQQHPSIEPAMVNLYSALCADHIAFNSDWNRDSFLAGVTALLDKLPDEVPPALLERLATRSSVLPVPLPDALFDGTSRSDACVCPAETVIVWNHRHEYDKGPQRLLLTVQALIRRGLRFRLQLLGQRFRRRPPAFAELETLLAQYYAAQGIAPGVNAFISDREQYEQLLRSADLVLSTADHDFQGLSMLEASALGCFAIAPHALAYPEYLPHAGLYPVLGLELTAQAEAAAELIEHHAMRLRASAGEHRPGHDVSWLQARQLAPRWRETLQALLQRRR